MVELLRGLGYTPADRAEMEQQRGDISEMLALRERLQVCVCAGAISASAACVSAASVFAASASTAFAFTASDCAVAAVGAARLPRHPGRHRAGPKFSGSRRKSPDLRGRKRDRVQDQE